VLCRYRHKAHSTGHQKRLGRESMLEAAPFGSPTYSVEELVAEMGAAFLCAESGISPAVIDNQAAYVGGWLKKLRDDRKLVVHAAAHAMDREPAAFLKETIKSGAMPAAFHRHS